MGLISKLFSSRKKSNGKRNRNRTSRSELAVQRRCAFEAMEPRRMLSANPLVLGTVYIEEDLGSDLHGDRFEVTFSGGAAETELTRLVINGDRGTPGFGLGDLFFDTEPTGLGGDHAAGFEVQQLITQNPAARVDAHVVDGQSLLVLDLQGFQAGDKLVFSIDVDEVEYYDPSETDLDIINEGFDPITSGVEFQGSLLTAHFSAPHYQDADGSGTFRNRYDDQLVASGLNLPEDNAGGQRDRSTGAFLNTQQMVDPAAISGYVYEDNDNDGIRDPGEAGIAGVTIQVIPVDTMEVQQLVTVTTDATGYYEATDLAPGLYRVVEVQQPDGYLDGLDTAGTVSGVVSGVSADERIENIFLGGGTAGIEYNFGELVPSSIEGHVRLTDSDGKCYAAGGDSTPLADVLVHLLDDDGDLLAQTTTDLQGHYIFTGLGPGLYTVVEFTPEGLIDAGAQAGHVGSSTRGKVVNANTIAAVNLAPAEYGREYDFCEHLPSSISGFVYHDQDNDGVRDAAEQPIAGVRVALKDSDGNTVGTQTTDEHGFYLFTGLSADQYTLVETQPSGWLDGLDTPGTVDGRNSGVADMAGDALRSVVLKWGSEGLEYNFGELLPGSIQGLVHADTERNCTLDPGEALIAGVTIELLDGEGRVLAKTTTDSQGRYRFENLTPGEYSVHELQPQDYFHGGQRAGSHGGNAAVADLITEVMVGSGQQLVDYDFCEVPPGSLSGIVYVDPNQNQAYDSGETLLQGVTIQLLDQDGRVVATRQTDQAGYYEFTNLRPGVYGVHELQPAGYFHGGQQAGSHGGDDSLDDLLTRIGIGPGQDLVQYNFSEIPPSSLGGSVHVSPNPDCANPNGEPLQGVQIELLDADGRVLATTRTDGQGNYRFEQLRPGMYTVRETQPQQYFHGGQFAGSGGGVQAAADLITSISVGAGVDLVNYNFCELPPASLSGYVFQDGPTIQTSDGLAPSNLLDVRDGLKTPDDVPIAGVVVELRNGINGEVITADQALPGAYPDGPLRALTDASGYYQFLGLPRGNYAVYETQPDGYIDHLDTPGTTQGLAINPHAAIDELVLQRLTTPHNNDAIILIPLAAGQSSEFNNFSEVRVERTVVQLPPPLPVPPTWTPPVIVAPPPAPWLLGPLTQPGAINIVPQYAGAGELRMSWHLSIVDGGMPRGSDAEVVPQESQWHTVSHLNHAQWNNVALNEGLWVRSGDYLVGTATPDQGIVFGMADAIPISGDFNGDGVSEVGMYHEGQWFVDLNGNGLWDEGDLWARLGGEFDLPVVGDWDGDGKDDIGIYGPEWTGDERAIKAEPGLPDPQNVYKLAPKNLPPEAAEATDGHRLLKRTVEGDLRVDVIDHVFRFGIAKDLPVSGDWNGDGIDAIGVFRNGTWYLDTDGDGRFTERDAVERYGTEGDVPVVGDFNRDGIDELGVYRNGTWYLDANGNREMDAHDKVFQMGDPSDRPVTGDWDGDGQDDPSLYRHAG